MFCALKKMTREQTKSNVFTEDGRLLQTEYAIKNVSKAGTIVGLTCSDGVILMGINNEPSRNIEKIYKISDTIYCAVSGIFSDALRLIKYARLTSANIEEVIGEESKLSVLCNKIAMKKQQYTQGSGARPFGVSFLFCQYENDEYVLYATDPSGTVNRWRAWAFGKNEDTINTSLKNELPANNQSLEESLKILLRIVEKARENPSDAYKTMEILVYKKDQVKILEAEEIRKILELERSSSKLNE